MLRGGRAIDGGGVKKTLLSNSLMEADRPEAGGGGWSSEEICNPSVGTVSAGGLGGCHLFGGVGVTTCFAWSRVLSVPAAFRGWLFGAHGHFFLWVRGFFEGGGWTESGRWSGGRG